jgi:hypothetical protein
LNGTQFSTLYSVGINDPEGQENITTKFGGHPSISSVEIDILRFFFF